MTDPSIEPDWNVRFTKAEMERMQKACDEMDNGRRRRFASQEFGTAYPNGAAKRSGRRRASAEEIRLWIALWEMKMESALRNG